MTSKSPYLKENDLIFKSLQQQSNQSQTIFLNFQQKKSDQNEYQLNQTLQKCQESFNSQSQNFSGCQYCGGSLKISLCAYCQKNTCLDCLQTCDQCNQKICSICSKIDYEYKYEKLICLFCQQK